jgi:hypothetical protein
MTAGAKRRNAAVPAAGPAASSPPTVTVDYPRFAATAFSTAAFNFASFGMTAPI